MVVDGNGQISGLIELADRFSPFTYGRDIKVSPQDPQHALCLSERRGLIRALS
jgi:hypothetical protein